MAMTVTLLRWLLLLLSGCLLVLARKDPEVAKKMFDSPIDLVEYFDDSDVVLLRTFKRDSLTLWRSEDAGQSWKEQEELKDAIHLIIHPYDSKVAFALTQGRRYWVTHDRGKKWKPHDLPKNVEPMPRVLGVDLEILNFHADDKKKVIFNAVRFDGKHYQAEAYYSKDGFEHPNHLKELRSDTRGCSWAHELKEFAIPEDKHAKDRIICLVKGKFTGLSFDQRLLVTDNYFKDEKEPTMSNGRTLQGVVNIAHVKGYLVAAVRAENSREHAMFVSVDGLTWHRAEFAADHKLQERSYTVLESTDYSLQVAVTTSASSLSSVLLSSNSNGTYFSENMANLRRDPFENFVDFEKVMGFRGVILVNTLVDHKSLRTQISFRDGKQGSWKSLKAGDDQFHLHSVTEKRNPGRVYSSAAPGVLMGVGNIGDQLKRYEEGDLFVSNNAGHDWKHAAKGPHKYAFGDQGNVLMAVPDKGLASGVIYSLDHGSKWEELKIDGEKFHVNAIMTAPDSVSRTFLIIAETQTEEGPRQVVISINMDGVLERDCKDDDLEDFKAHEDDCVMGKRYVYRRRKPEADCFLRSKYKNHKEEAKSEVCTCTNDDFECDIDFIPKGEECVPAMSRAPEGQCSDDKQTFKDKSGFRLVPHNECRRDGGPSLDKDVERKCSDVLPDPHTGDIVLEASSFEGHQELKRMVYLERTKISKGDDETIIIMTVQQGHTKVYISADHGKKWERILKGESIIDIVKHEYDNDAVFFLTKSKKVHYSYNRGKTFGSFTVSQAFNPNFGEPALSFHQDDSDTLIWTGASSATCDPSDRDCHLISRITKDRGDEWHTLKRYTKKCEFVKREGRTNKVNATQLIYCSVHRDEDPKAKLQLVRSDDLFAHTEVVLDPIIEFQTMSEFVVAAGATDDQLLFVNASVSGSDFAPAHFPPKFSTIHQTFTVLQSETHSIFLHATVSMKPGFEHGRILKSNSNGTFYVTSLDAVSRDGKGYVDFEKVRGIEGVSIANIVSSPEESQGTKKLKTVITHNDGGDWAPLPFLEAKDSGGRSYECRRVADCGLHLYGYTHKSRPYSSSSGVGLLFGNGNVGEYLDESGENDAVFMSADAGLNWREVQKGRHDWAFGDQGSLIGLVQKEKKTNILRYSTNEGRKWEEYKFADEPVEVFQLSNTPSDNSKSFIIWAQVDGSLVTYNIDFAGTRKTECNLDEDNPENSSSDYYIWSPEHPFQENKDCLFGHVAVYHRKKPDSVCWNGPLIDSHGLHEIARDCKCTRADFECDYNYQKAADGACDLVPGLDPPDRSQICKDNASEYHYYIPTGYRRIPLDTCRDGQELEFQRWQERVCPGHEEEYEERHRGLSGFAFFLVAIVLPFSVAGGIGYFIYKKWDGKLGAIRLGESSADAVLDIDKPWVRYPVMAISAVVAVALAAPGILASAWRVALSLVRKSGGRYTTRESFARSRGEYTVVDDEDELLGEDEEDEV